MIELNVTTKELTNVLIIKEKGTWCYLRTETKVRMNKTGNPYFDRVTKISFLNVLIGNDYGKRVIKETGDTEFKPEICKVGEHISKCVLHNDNTGKDYLQYENFNYKTIPNYPKNLIPPDPQYIFEGDAIEKEIFESFMTKSSPNKYGVNYLSVTISNIKECHIDGVHYIVNNEPIEVKEHNQVEVEV